MPTAGNPNLWAKAFPSKLIPDIVALVEGSWATFNQPQPSDLEVPITRLFRCHMATRKNSLRTLPVRIERESVEDDLAAGVEMGRIDIRFVYVLNCREDVYFAFECKRLNVPPKSTKKPSKPPRTLAVDYVERGMMRYVTGQYGAALRHGGMIGFVMNGDGAAASNSVRRAIASRKKTLRMKDKDTLASSTLVPSRSAVKETIHHLDKRRVFRIHHVFLPVS